MLDNILGYHHHHSDDSTSPGNSASSNASPGLVAGASPSLGANRSASPSPSPGANRASPVAGAWLSVQRVVLNDPFIQVTPLACLLYIPDP